MGRHQGSALSAHRPYRIQVAAQVSGVSEGLIRAWERRYGVLVLARTKAGYRTYGDADIEVLKRLKQLTDEGVSISQAVLLLPKIRREAKGGKAHKPPRALQLQRWSEEVLLAASRLDQAAIDATLDEAAHSMPPILFSEEFIAPLLREVGERWHQGTLTIAEEHLITSAARQRLVTLLEQAPRRAKRHVVCACPANENHELGLLGAALRFRHAGWRVTFLGAQTPIEHLDRVVRAVRPDLVAISAIETRGAAEYVKQLEATLPQGTHVVLGGAGAPRNTAFHVIEGNTDWARLLRSSK
jgi:DNA-binding transcriptional MerR regulator